MNSSTAKRTWTAVATITVEDGAFEKLRKASPIYRGMSDEEIFEMISADIECPLGDSWSQNGFDSYIGPFEESK